MGRSSPGGDGPGRCGDEPGEGPGNRGGGAPGARFPANVEEEPEEGRSAPRSGPDRRAGGGAPPSPAATERLHKFLASTGAGSRRECETFIAQGRVSVNGKVVNKMGVKVDPRSDTVLLDGERVRPEDRVYYLLHKPGGFICTNSDERGRPRAVDLVKDEHRIYTVGRLDADSTGIVLLTNDGEIANVVCHPRYRIEKRYHVFVRGDVTRAQVARVEAGVWLAEGKSSPARVHPIGRNPKRGETILEMVLYEGRNREIRRIFARVGLTVRRLQRISIGPLVLGDLPAGAHRRLTRAELVFVDEAERMYLANKEAWDAELPPAEPRRREGFSKGRRGRPQGKPMRGKPTGGGAGKPAHPWGEGSFPAGVGAGRPEGPTTRPEPRPPEATRAAVGGAGRRDGVGGAQVTPTGGPPATRRSAAPAGQGVEPRGSPPSPPPPRPRGRRAG